MQYALRSVGRPRLGQVAKLLRPVQRPSARLPAAAAGMLAGKPSRARESERASHPGRLGAVRELGCQAKPSLGPLLFLDLYTAFSTLTASQGSS